MPVQSPREGHWHRSLVRITSLIGSASWLNLSYWCPLVLKPLTQITGAKRLLGRYMHFEGPLGIRHSHPESRFQSASGAARSQSTDSVVPTLPAIEGTAFAVTAEQYIDLPLLLTL